MLARAAGVSPGRSPFQDNFRAFQEPVSSQYSCRLSLVESQQPSQALTCANFAQRLADPVRWRWKQDHIPLPLVVLFPVTMGKGIRLQLVFGEAAMPSTFAAEASAIQRVESQSPIGPRARKPCAPVASLIGTPPRSPRLLVLRSAEEGEPPPGNTNPFHRRESLPCVDCSCWVIRSRVSQTTMFSGVAVDWP